MGDVGDVLPLGISEIEKDKSIPQMFFLLRWFALNADVEVKQTLNLNFITICFYCIVTAYAFGLTPHLSLK